MGESIEQAEAALARAKNTYLSELKRDSERREGSGAQERRREEIQEALRLEVEECELDLEAARRFAAVRPAD